MKKLFILLAVFTMNHLQAQEGANLPFYSIPNAPEEFTEGNLISRMIDGLGYRYHWATENLSTSDLAYKPSESGKSSLETIQHIYDLSVTIRNVAFKLPNVRPYEKQEITFVELRTKTLQNLLEARTQFLEKTNKELEEYMVVFKRGEKESSFPFWNFINGPLTDAIYHTGQLVVFRRASGNPINPNVRVFTGVNAE